jgi:5-methyltetrahydropteroyltriglutamate--homocysteine methyltransferase
MLYDTFGLREDLIQYIATQRNYSVDWPGFKAELETQRQRAQANWKAALSEKSSPEEELTFAVDLLNRVVEGVEGIKTGLHVCRGNWSRQETVLLQGAYDPLMPYFSRMQVQQLVLEYATDRAGSVEVLGDLPADKEIGLGVCNPRSAEIESVDFIVAKVKPLLQHRRPEQIYLNPDCGFGTFAERPVNTADVAAQKLRAIHQAAEVLRAEYA